METLHENIRQKYVFPPYGKEKAICMGTKKDCWSLIDKGFARIKYGDLISPNVQMLYIKPTLQNLQKKSNLNFITENIKYLWMPLPLLGSLTNTDLAANVECLILENKEIYVDSSLFSDLSSQVFLFKDSLKSLVFIGDNNHAGLYWSNLNIDINQFRNIEYISTLVNNRVVEILLQSNFTQLKHIDLSIVDITSIQLFDLLSKYSNIESLSLSSINILNIEGLNKCKAIYINGGKQVDCTVFERLKNLREIVLMGVEKVVNIESLLHLSSLENIRIINCSNPIKRKVKEEFLSKRFDVLDIEYA